MTLEEQIMEVIQRGTNEIADDILPNITPMQKIHLQAKLGNITMRVISLIPKHLEKIER